MLLAAEQGSEHRAKAAHRRVPIIAIGVVRVVPVIPGAIRVVAVTVAIGAATESERVQTGLRVTVVVVIGAEALGPMTMVAVGVASPHQVWVTRVDHAVHGTILVVRIALIQAIRRLVITICRIVISIGRVVIAVRRIVVAIRRLIVPAGALGLLVTSRRMIKATILTNFPTVLSNFTTVLSNLGMALMTRFGTRMVPDILVRSIRQSCAGHRKHSQADSSRENPR